MNLCSYIFYCCLDLCSSFGLYLGSLLNFFSLSFFLSLLISFCFNCFLPFCCDLLYLLTIFFSIWYFFKKYRLEILSILCNCSDSLSFFLFLGSNQTKLFKKNPPPLRPSKGNKLILWSFRYYLILFLIF